MCIINENEVKKLYAELKTQGHKCDETKGTIYFKPNEKDTEVWTVRELEGTKERFQVQYGGTSSWARDYDKYITTPQCQHIIEDIIKMMRS